MLDLLRSQRHGGNGLQVAPDAEAVELMWEECGIPEGHDLTRPAWERFMLQVSSWLELGASVHVLHCLVHYVWIAWVLS